MATRRSVPKPDIASSEASVVDALAGDTIGRELRLVYVDPRQLVLTGNIRLDPRLDNELLESVDEDGVLEPVSVVDRAGQYEVIDGQRRTLAAIDKGKDVIPAIVSTPPAETADGIAEQLKRNELRQALTEADRAGALQQLAGLGLTADQIVRKTKTKPEKVSAALTLIGHETTSELLEAVPQLDLVQVAAVAEFEDDPEIYEALVNALSGDPERAEHTIENYRSKRAEKHAIAARAAELTAEGITILTDMTGWIERYRLTLKGKQYLSNDDIRDALLPDHADLLGAYLHAYRTYGDEPGFRVDASYYVARGALDAGLGFAMQSTGAAPKGPKSEAEKTQARKDRADKKLWEDAAAVRERFAKDLLQRAKAPAGWENVAAWAAAGTFGYGTGLDDQKHTARDWLGAIGPVRSQRKLDGVSVEFGGAERFLERHPNRAPQLLLAHALACAEKRLAAVTADFKPWRASKPWIGPYLAWLQSAGYTLSRIESDVVEQDAKRLKKLASIIAKENAGDDSKADD